MRLRFRSWHVFLFKTYSRPKWAFTPFMSIWKNTTLLKITCSLNSVRTKHDASFWNAVDYLPSLVSKKQGNISVTTMTKFRRSAEHTILICFLGFFHFICAEANNFQGNRKEQWIFVEDFFLEMLIMKVFFWVSKGHVSINKIKDRRIKASFIIYYCAG